jgi:hypothetical protein
MHLLDPLLLQPLRQSVKALTIVSELLILGPFFTFEEGDMKMRFADIDAEGSHCFNHGEQS